MLAIGPEMKTEILATKFQPYKFVFPFLPRESAHGK